MDVQGARKYSKHTRGNRQQTMHTRQIPVCGVLPGKLRLPLALEARVMIPSDVMFFFLSTRQAQPSNDPAGVLPQLVLAALMQLLSQQNVYALTWSTRLTCFL